MKQECPSEQEWIAFHAGQLANGADIESLGQHLDTCSKCRMFIPTQAGASPDPLLSALSVLGQQSARQDAEPAVRQLVSRLFPDKPTVDTPGLTPIRNTVDDEANHSNQANEIFDDHRRMPVVDLIIPEFRDYQIIRLLGVGGMGLVYEAIDRRLERNIAIKVLRPSRARDQAARNQFLAEARSAARLKHDHIVTIHYVGEEEQVAYLVMELLAGASLENILKVQTKLPLPEILRICREIALGLSAAHGCGLVHGDIKPGNIWIESEEISTNRLGRAKIVDFGLARPAADRASGKGTLAGTPAYMAPEQRQRGAKLDGRADLYSLGRVLRTLLLGQVPVPFDSWPSSNALVYEIAKQRPELAKQPITNELGKLLHSLLAPHPEDRPANAKLVADKLAQLIEHVSAKPTAYRVRVFVSTVTVLACIVVGLTVWGRWPGKAARPPVDWKGTPAPTSDEILTPVEDYDRRLATLTFPLDCAYTFRFLDTNRTILHQRSNVPLPEKPFRVIYVDFSDPSDSQLSDIFDILPRCQELAFLGLQGRAARLLLSPRLSELACLRLDGVRVGRPNSDPIDWRCLKTWPTLRNFSLSDADYDDSSLAPVFDLMDLDQVSINNCPITNETAIRVVQLPKLKNVWLNSDRLTDAAAEALIRRPKLDEVTLYSSALTDGVWVHLDRIPALRSLRIGGARITGEILGRIGLIDRLENLEIQAAPLMERGIARIAASKSIRSICFNRVFLSDQSINHLLRMKDLQSLNFLNLSPSKDQLDRLRIGLPNCRITTE